jgi:protease-4
MEQPNNYQGEPGYRANYYQPPKKTNRWLWLLVVGLLILVTVGGLWLVGRSFSTPEAVYLNEPNIARIFVEGTITGEFEGDYDHQFLLDTIDTLEYDDNNMALLVYIDSPGGEVLASDELANKITAYKETTGRPVYVYGHNMMASGGYWIACAGDWIVANRYCTTGSIGVTYGSFLDLSGFLEKYGIKVNTITSGAQKSMGSSLEEMTPETEAIFQIIIDEYYGYFLDWVSTNRPLTRDALIPLADGRIYTATQAETYQLIDQVGTYEDALAALDEALGAVYPVEDYYSSEELSFWDQFSWLDYVFYGGEETEAILELLPPTGPLAYYEGE